MIGAGVARRYASALLQIGLEGQRCDAFGEELGRVMALVRGSHELRGALGNPVFPLSQRKAALLAVLDRVGVSTTARSFLALLLERGRFAELDSIEREYRTMADRAAGRVRAEVTSARPLEGDVAARLAQALEKATGKTVLLEKKVEPELLGGLTLKVGSLLYDGSVRARLSELRERLVEG
ncbi:MAG: ATP synthase F1 subunit delta [Myxococcota bacterium]